MNKSKNNKISEMIRVNHAGEMGAKVIYDGQILALKLKKDFDTLKIVEHMKNQENKHFDFFDEEMKKEQIRPTLMQPIWKVGGFALGFLTAIINKKSAMTCTTAVEEVIDKHYQQQIEDINHEEKNSNKNNKQLQNLKEQIIKFREEEIEHKEIAYNNNANQFFAHKTMTSFIKFTTNLAITISKKI